MVTSWSEVKWSEINLLSNQKCTLKNIDLLQLLQIIINSKKYKLNKPNLFYGNI